MLRDQCSALIVPRSSASCHTMAAACGARGLRTWPRLSCSRKYVTIDDSCSSVLQIIEGSTHPPSIEDHRSTGCRWRRCWVPRPWRTRRTSPGCAAGTIGSNGLLPMQIAAQNGDQRMVKHILRRQTRTVWKWGPVTQYEIDLEGIDSAGEGGNDLMELIGSSEARCVRLLEVAGGVADACVHLLRSNGSRVDLEGVRVACNLLRNLAMPVGSRARIGGVDGVFASLYAHVGSASPPPPSPGRARRPSSCSLAHRHRDPNCAALVGATLRLLVEGCALNARGSALRGDRATALGFFRKFFEMATHHHL